VGGQVVEHDVEFAVRIGGDQLYAWSAM
jgi:hypothetical protein